ncbi:MAG: NAD(P)-dependent oxidoreductase [Chlorobiaceae bacterium]|nr:NAD(P)-dependent oxidoreductase [Chlorobiaceae bacterium]MBA4310511.1 NAD(P)-dependent oxidoreductase [Chlorobiaceae bacterium]
MLLKDKTVLITGASSGIGKSTAELFSKNGANLILTGRRKERLEELKQKLSSEYSVSILSLVFDIRNYDEVKKNISSLNSVWKNIDILINNAGMGRGLDKFQDGNVENWEEMIDTNLKGLLYITKEILPVMVERKSGHIINIGSTAGHDVYPAGNIYCATKFAVNAISQSLRIDLLDKRIKVSSVDPGMVETEFSNVRFFGDTERAKSVYKGLTPLTPEDVAEAILFCATRPYHVNINEIILTPIAQAQSNFIIRENQ